MLQSTTLTQKGQVTIPLPLREKLGLITGMKILFSVHQYDENKLVISVADDILNLQGSIKSRKKYSKQAARKAYMKDVLAGKI